MRILRGYNGRDRNAIRHDRATRLGVLGGANLRHEKGPFFSTVERVCLVNRNVHSTVDSTVEWGRGTVDSTVEWGRGTVESRALNFSLCWELEWKYARFDIGSTVLSSVVLLSVACSAAWSVAVTPCRRPLPLIPDR